MNPIQSQIVATDQLISLSELLRQAVRHGDATVYRSICETVAERLLHVAQNGHQHLEGIPRMPRILQERLGISSLGSAKLLAVLLTEPGRVVGFSEITLLCECSNASLLRFAAGLRRYLRNIDLDKHFSGNQRVGFAVTAELAEQIREMSRPGRVAPVTNELGVVAAILRRDLALRSWGEAQLLFELLRYAGTPRTAAELCELLDCHPKRLRISITLLRADLQAFHLHECIATVPARGSARGGYVLREEYLPVIQSNVSFNLADLAIDAPGENVRVLEMES